jgi:SAM-dependent methyltransferase
MTIEEIKIANSTYRRSGSSVFDKDGNVRSVVARYVEKNIGKDKKILDYGCGSEFIQGNYLRQKGFDVDGWDIGSNKPENCVVELRQIYDVVYASNVLNVISSPNMLAETLSQIYGCLKSGGVFIANYPTSPRKMFAGAASMKDMLDCFFEEDINIVGGTKSAQIWCVVKS